jgi:hypothetical protein
MLTNTVSLVSLLSTRLLSAAVAKSGLEHVQPHSLTTPDLRSSSMTVLSSLYSSNLAQMNCETWSHSRVQQAFWQQVQHARRQGWLA